MFRCSLMRRKWPHCPPQEDVPMRFKLRHSHEFYTHALIYIYLRVCKGLNSSLNLILQRVIIQVWPVSLLLPLRKPFTCLQDLATRMRLQSANFCERVCENWILTPFSPINTDYLVSELQGWVKVIYCLKSCMLFKAWRWFTALLAQQ